MSVNSLNPNSVVLTFLSISPPHTLKMLQDNHMVNMTILDAVTLLEPLLKHALHLWRMENTLSLFQVDVQLSLPLSISLRVEIT